MRILPAFVQVLLAASMGAQARSVPVTVPLIGSSGTVGQATFRETMKGELNIDLVVHALTRGEHAVHIHSNPFCEPPGFQTAGPHFNPDGKQHGRFNPAGHHAGDLSENILVDANGDGHMNITAHDLDLTPGASHSVLGRSIVVHERPDDGRSDPGGNSGNRIACGVIPAGIVR